MSFDKTKANQAYERAKKLYFEKNDLVGAIKEMQETIRFDEDQKGERHYQLAKLCIMAHQEYGIPNQDAVYAVLAHQYFSIAKEKGKVIKNQYLEPIKAVARLNYEKAIKVFRGKESADYLALSIAYLKNSLKVGGLPEGEIEYDLARIYSNCGRADLAYEYYQMAMMRGMKLSYADENFIDTYESNRSKSTDTSDEVKKVLSQLESVKVQLAAAQDTLTKTKLKINQKIPIETHNQVLSELQSIQPNSNIIAAEMKDLDDKYVTAAKDPSNFEYHIEVLKDVGISSKALLELASGNVDLASGINNLFWIKKLDGQLQLPLDDNLN